MYSLKEIPNVPLKKSVFSLTLSNDQVAYDKYDRMAAVDEITAVRVFAVDRQAEAGHQREDTFGDNHKTRGIRLR